VGNKATIIFDDNPPILTPVWQNIIDTIKPESHVDPLPITNNSDTIFLHWTGSDNGPAGLYAYNIYYNVNGGPWLLWRINTSAVIDTFIAVSNGIYSFYSRAIDSAFNIEDNPSGADATTTIGSILPVKLLSFFVKKESKQNILSWKTSHETTTDRFEIQRSTNGWEFAAIGNTKPNLTFDYIYHDRNPVRAINYYRLKTIDKDGRFQFSPIRSINNTDQSLIIYPNPVTTKRVSVYGLNAFEGGYVFELYTMEGKLLFIHEGVVSSSILNVVINLPSFISQGSYIMKMKNKNNAFHQLVFVK
jgi:hypothetical protein